MFKTPFGPIPHPVSCSPVRPLTTDHRPSPTVIFTSIIAAVLVALLLMPSAQAAPWVGKDFRGKDCEGFQGTAGTLDYLHRGNPRVASSLALTEEHHFNEDVETLRKGITTDPMGDVDFVLRSFPNHHRALYTSMQYRLKHRKWPNKAKWQPAECYYQRAINFSPRDLTVHTQFAILQYKFKQYKGALESYQIADRLSPEDPLLMYNMALTMVKLKKYKDAKAVAEKVYATGFPLPGLRNKLITAGHWKDETSAETLEDKAQKLEEERGRKAAAAADEASKEGPPSTGKPEASGSS